MAKKEDRPRKAPALELAKVGDSYEAALGPRLYRIGGIEKINSLEVLKITLPITCEGMMYVDSLDLNRERLTLQIH